MPLREKTSGLCLGLSRRLDLPSKRQCSSTQENFSSSIRGSCSYSTARYTHCLNRARVYTTSLCTNWFTMRRKGIDSSANQSLTIPIHIGLRLRQKTDTGWDSACLISFLRLEATGNILC